MEPCAGSSAPRLCSQAAGAALLMPVGAVLGNQILFLQSESHLPALQLLFIPVFPSKNKMPTAVTGRKQMCGISGKAALIYSKNRHLLFVAGRRVKLRLVIAYCGLIVADN